ncbi:MAG TPA: FAD:protein FMN transferase [Jatrophihabitans sp.]|nr:FAD:protein FMN transferase [Jatrophihabitans sp.]
MPVRHTEPVMGTVFSFELRDCDDPAVLEPVLARLHELDACYSTYQQDSIISRLNRREIGYDSLPEEVRQVLTACQSWHTGTDGWFDIHRDGSVDPSGYVKGWAIDEASRLLVAAGSHWHSVNGGGDILAVAPPGARPWRFGIIDPRDNTQLRGTVSGHRVALATSGIAERGEHIWDPFTGAPARSTVLSLSVSGRDIIECDVLATAGFARGDGAVAWLRGRPGIEVLACYADGSTSEQHVVRFEPTREASY